MYQVNFYHLNPLQLAGPCKDDGGQIIRYNSLVAATVAATKFNMEFKPKHGVYSAAEYKGDDNETGIDVIENTLGRLLSK
jgi:hypothetical protein